MSITIEDLDESINFDDAVEPPRFISGKNQIVHWRDCFVWIYDSSGAITERLETCNGSCIVVKGSGIFLGGKGGKVKM